MTLLCSNESIRTIVPVDFQRFTNAVKCEPIMEQVECMPYPKVNTLLAGLAAYGDRKAAVNAQVTHLNISNICKAYDSYIKFTSENPKTVQTTIGFHLMGNKKLCTVPSDATAYYSRKSHYNLIIVQRWADEQDDRMVFDWAKNVQNIFNKDCIDDKSLYINFESTTDESHYDDVKAERFFGENLTKLRKLKMKYDPSVLFRKGVVIWPL